MKRSVSMILALLLTFSGLFVGTVLMVSATEPEGVGIADLSTLENSSGTFYLTADIGSAENPVTSSVSEFGGTLDGNGHKIYTSAPVFDLLNGATVKNLTIEGNVAPESGDFTAALARRSAGNTTVANCVNNVNVSQTVTQAPDSGIGTYAGAGGFVGFASGGVDVIVTFKDCVNNGEVGATSRINKATVVGGYIATAKASAIFEDCVNNGDIWIDATNEAGTASNTAMAGGLIGWGVTSSMLAKNCENNGKIEDRSAMITAGHKFGGLIAVLQGGTYGTFLGCTNTGDVYGLMAGGLVGDIRNENTFTTCVNRGNITSKNEKISGSCIAGGMIASINVNTDSAITRCVNLGTIEAENKMDTDALAGGLIGQILASSAVNVTECVGYGTVNSSSSKSGSYGEAGGLLAMTKVKVSMTDCIVYGDITGTYAAGGIAAEMLVEESVFTRCIYTGSVNQAYYHRSSILGKITFRDANPEKYMLLTDCYGTFARGIGVYAQPNEIKGNIRYIWTNENVDQTIIGGTDTVSASDAGSVLSLYNAPFAANGYMPKADMKGVFAAKNLSILNFGDETWILREDFPELAFVETLFGASTNPKADASIVYVGVQNSAVSDGKFAVRFVSSVESLEYSKIGVRVEVAEKGVGSALATERSSRYVYEQILAAGDNGVPTAYPEIPLANTWFSALTITEIPASGTYIFVVTPFTVSADGETTDRGGAIAIVYTDGVFVNQYWYAAPTR
ncbi:MAG: hypothetical protein J5885_04580 [Clostridia bacterium]|nr:hypothetical protein [Clostridia bacterium]